MRVVPIRKQSKLAQKAYYSKKRGSWNGVCPVTRVVPSGKVYDRNRDKREIRRNRVAED